MVCTFFKPNTANINYENYSLHHSDRDTTVTETGVVTTPSSPKDFDFYDHVRSHFLVALSTRATLKNAIKRSKIKQKEKSGKISKTNIFFLLNT